MKYKKYVYVIYSQSKKMIIGLFSSQKRLHDWAIENELKVYNDFFSSKIRHDNHFSNRNYDLIPVKIPLDETCDNLLADYLGKTNQD
ncbi:MAG: hypothetical protein K8Q99_02060 [Acholeplasmataceae bacterium]|nr:hypothetical protein [Acholeplasmataceae bacterium]MCD4826550.1 hypothetical protein [Acholeplasmataceae bacterium]